MASSDREYGQTVKDIDAPETIEIRVLGCPTASAAHGEYIVESMLHTIESKIALVARTKLQNAIQRQMQTRRL